MRKLLTNIAKITILTRIKTDKKKEAKEDPKMSPNIVKVRRIFLGS